MPQKYRRCYLKGLVLVAAMTLTASCSKSGSQDYGPSTQVSEFTVLNPETGLPLKPEDLTEEMLKEDSDVVSGRGDIQTLDVHETPVDVQKSKDVMLFGYTPDGSYNSYLTPQCYHTEVERMIASSEGYTSNLAQDFQSWVNRCERELSRYQTNPIATVLKFAWTKYDITKNNIKRIDLEFDDKSKLGALLAMKPGKRPLIIFKAGSYSNAEDSEVTRNFVMHLFEESPFHILYLANVNGTEFMEDNQSVALGGVDEGRRILKVADMMTHDPRYKDLIEDVHVVGVSLGSHSVLYSSLYNSYDNNQTKIKSAVALCPVIDLQPTIKSVFELSLAGLYYQVLTTQVFHEVYDSIPVLRELLPRSPYWTREQLYNASTKAVLAHYTEETSKTPIDMAPFNGERISNIEDYWKLNDFISYADQVKTPTLIVHSRDDFIVQSSLNADELLKKTQNYNSNLGIVEFQNGAHCALNVANGWSTISSMLRTFILAHSTYKDQSGKTMTVSFKSPSMGSLSKISKFTFAAKKNKSSVEVNIEYFDGSLTATGGQTCKRFDPLYAPPTCYGHKIEKVDLGQLDDLGLKTPKSDFETQRLTRWFNTHATLLNKNYDVILGTNLWPTSLSFDSKSDFQN